jgi:hypothetical protein
MTDDDLIQRGKRIADSGKYPPQIVDSGLSPESE